MASPLISMRTLTILLLVVIQTLQAQVPQRVMVEHFTNTRCGICANRNPALYLNLDDHPDVLHLAVHPSAPYANCELHLHNPGDNDERTLFYDVYGGIPRIVIQGEVQSASVNFGDPDLFEPYLNKMSNHEVETSLRFAGGTDSIEVSVALIRVAPDGLDSARLYVALAESVVDYEAPNGEHQHYDVMRRAVFGERGTMVALASQVSDTLWFNETVALDSRWKTSRLYSSVILQRSDDNSVLQAATSEGQEILKTDEAMVHQQPELYPNPSTGTIYLKGPSVSWQRALIYDALGRQVMSIEHGLSHVRLQGLPDGAYYLQLHGKDRVTVLPFMLQTRL